MTAARRRVEWIALFAAIALTGSRAGAQDAPLIEWAAPDDCPTREAVVAEIERLLGRRIAGAVESGFRATIQIEPTPAGRMHARVDIARGGPDATTERSTREVTATTCALAADAVAVVVAVVIDPAIVPPPAPAGVETSPPAETRSQARTRPAPPVEPAAPPPHQAETAPLDLDVSLFVGASLAGGALPGIGAGVRGGAAIAIARLRVEAGVDYWPAREQRLGSTFGGRFDLVVASLAGCFTAIRAGALDARGCAKVELGSIGGEGFGVSEPSSGSSLWLAAGLAAAAAYRIARPLEAWLALEAVFPFERPPFVLEGVGSVYRSSFADFRAAAGGAVHF